MKHLLEKLRARFNAATDKHDAEMPVTMKNYILLLAGFIVIIIGMVLMCGGGSDSPEEVSPLRYTPCSNASDTPAGTRRRTLRHDRHAPIRRRRHTAPRDTTVQMNKPHTKPCQ